MLSVSQIQHPQTQICRYAAQRIQGLEAAGKLTHGSRFGKWYPTTTTELQGFLAIILNMGLIELPHIEDYWKTSWETEIPFFRRVVPRDRFELLFWLLHVSHSDSDQEKRIDKVGLLLKSMLTRFRRRYYPGCELAVDETMVGFRGRFAAKQYMPNKPTKWGIKCFALADSANGYVLNVLVYTGRDTLEDAGNESLPQPARVVLHLAEAYLGCGHHMFTDRYYTSLPLAQTLHSLQTGFTGTCMKNRTDLPDDVRGQLRLQHGQVAAYRADHLLTLAWLAEKKKKPVIMVTTRASAATTTVSSRSTRTPTVKPAVVDNYNHHMNGVDLADQHAVYYSFIRKTVKWWRKVVFWLVETAVVNSYILYKETVPNPMTHVAYRRSVVQSLASRYIVCAPPRRLVGRPRKRSHPDGDVPERLNQRLHIVEQRSQRNCVVCCAAGRKSRPVYYCKTCQETPQPCIGYCFERYHTVLDY